MSNKLGLIGGVWLFTATLTVNENGYIFHARRLICMSPDGYWRFSYESVLEIRMVQKDA